MERLKVGIFGLGANGRGGAFVNSILYNDADFVACCEKQEGAFFGLKENYGEDFGCYTDFDEFLNHPGMNVVILANYFSEHAPYAIKALEKGMHVISECISNVTMAEGVALVRAAEKSKGRYMMIENCPFDRNTFEMNRIYKEGSLGKAMFCEGEYNHPVLTDEPLDINYLHPFKEHWRNTIPRTYYLSHSIGPLMYMTGATPKRVTTLPVARPEGGKFDQLMSPRANERAAIITTLNDDGSVFRVTGCSTFGGGGLSFRLCCDKGQIDTGRYGENVVSVIREGAAPQSYVAEYPFDEEVLEMLSHTGHGGSDHLNLSYCFKCIREDLPYAFDVYASTAISSVAILGHRSMLEYGVPYDIPDFRNEEDRVKYENDTANPFYGLDGSAPTMPYTIKEYKD